MSEPLFIDFETRSPVDLKVAGLGRYSLHPQTEVLCLAFAFGDGNILVWSPEMDIGETPVDHVAAGGIVVAHNAQFELAIWNAVMVPRFGWPRLDPRQVRCTMAACYAMALPGALENAAHSLGLKIAKDLEGRALMLKMCKPRGWDGKVPLYHDSPEMRARLGEYCKTDVAVEREIYKRVLPLTDQEQRLWVLDQEINLRGVPFDMQSVAAAIAMADQEQKRLDGEMAALTGGTVAKCSNIGMLKEWSADYGIFADGLAKADVSEWLDYEPLPEPVRAALKLRQAAGRFTSISKLDAITAREVASRVPYLFQFHAATTGRWAGRGVQPHNFTRDLPDPAEVEEILRFVREKNARMLDALYGEPSVMISKCLRGFIKAAPGNQLMGGDFSAVEGRGVAWLAGEEWKLQAYREIDADPTLPDMYERTYASTFGVDARSVTKLQRQVGKVEDLAFGYQGGVGAFRTMGVSAKVMVVKNKTAELVAKALRNGFQIFSENEVDDVKHGWRNASPKTKQYWYDLQNASIGAVLRPGEITRAGAPGRQVMFRKRGSFLWCRLPSGRTLCYPYPEVHHNDFGPFLTFKSVPDALVWGKFTKWKNDESPDRGPNPTYIVDEPTNTREWCRISTYGGKLTENITQAICRDLLAEAMLRVEAAGFHIVLHVHDEIVVEGVYGEDDRALFEQLMCVVPDWARDFPVNAGCWLSERYRKE